MTGTEIILGHCRSCVYAFPFVVDEHGQMECKFDPPGRASRNEYPNMALSVKTEPDRLCSRWVFIADTTWVDESAY